MALETFINYKTGCELVIPSNVSSFLLNDPDFDVDPDPSRGWFPGSGKAARNTIVPDSAMPAEPESDPGQTPLGRRIRQQMSVDDGSLDDVVEDIRHIRTGVSKCTLKRAPITYLELPEASRTLDGLLYNVLKMVIKGSKASLLSCVRNPSYVQAIYVLVNHMELSKFERILRALNSLDGLAWKGDVHEYQVDVMNAVREVRSCQANITHLILARIVKSFEGQSKTVQYTIAEIINSGVAIDDTLNLYDIVQSVCADIATVGDTKQAVNSIMDQLVCEFCNGKHRTADCRKFLAAKESLKRGDINQLPMQAQKQSKRLLRGNCNKCG